MSKKKNDPDLYRDLSHPFEARADASKAIEDFFEELYEIRAKYNIPDLVMCVQVNIKGEGPSYATISIGDDNHAESMAAMAYGEEVMRRQKRISQYLGGAIKNGK